VIRLLVGLGNPGASYEATRHNAGFWWVEAAARQLQASLQPEGRWFGSVARVDRPMPGVDGPVWLLEPMTYMNLSGKSVAALSRFYKIAPAEILVIHDELDLEPGQSKLKLGGSAAGHNGLKDIHAQLGTLDFWRLRIGIGHPGVKAEVVNFVLQKPSADHRVAIDEAIDRSLKALGLMLAGNMERAMTAVPASKPQRPKPPRPELA
jgi:peptidyl-tRNA hydrolase, PTH1 family